MTTLGRSSPYDVAIVGGGIIGTSAATFLAEAGHSVLLVERTKIAAGASGRNSGSVQSPFDPALVPLHLDTVALYRELSTGSSFELGERPAGILLLGTHEAAMRDQCRALMAARPDLDPRYVSGADLQELEPGLAPDLVAVLLATGYPVPPAAATSAFAERAVAAGATIRFGAATIWREGGTALGVIVDGVRIPAGMVLLAAGFETPGLVDPSGTWRPIRPVWGVNVEVELARPPTTILEQSDVEDIGTAGLDDGLPSTPADLESTFSLMTAAGSSSLGSTFLPWEPDPVAVAPVLRDRGSRFLPALRNAPIRSVRACTRPQSIDGRPLLGQVPGVDRLFICAGHGPWGISTGPGSAKLAVEAILGNPDVIPPELTAARFSNSFRSPGDIHER